MDRKGRDLALRIPGPPPELDRETTGWPLLPLPPLRALLQLHLKAQ